MKEVIISTEAVNSYGTRILTDGIDLEQYSRNPILLWMHRRNYQDTAGPIGRIENIRREGSKLIGTPVFDKNDAFARQVESKWENGFLRMASAGLEILEFSEDPNLILDNQTRATVTRSRLIEVSIVDIGSNNEALQLYSAGRVLNLSALEQHNELPLIKKENIYLTLDEKHNNNSNNENQMNKEFLSLLGLSSDATEEQALSCLTALKQKAEQAESIQLSAVTSAVDTAIQERRILAESREHFINLGKNAGLETLISTLKLISPQQKPSDVINLKRDSIVGNSGEKKEYTKLTELPVDELLALRKENPKRYAELYKAEYGIECPVLKD